MPDGMDNAVVDSGTPGAPDTPATPAVPDGKALVDAHEWESARRNAERARGMQSYYDAGRQLGLNSADDFGQLGEKLSRLQKLEASGLSLDGLLGAMEAADEPEVSGLSEERLLELLDERDKKAARTAAEKEWRAQFASESSLRDKALAELLGEDAPEPIRKLMEFAATGLLESNRGMLPDDHPLRDSIGFAPYTDESFTPHAQTLRELYDGLKGAELANIGKAASKPQPVSTPAGSSGGGGKPSDDSGPRSNADLIREKAEQVMAKRR
jgi:hypothetical protein